MKEGRNIQEIAQELHRQLKTKKDWIIPSRQLVVTADKDQVGFAFDGAKLSGATDNGHNQLASYCNIPREYYRRCLAEEPKLVADNLNAWLLKKEKSDRRMVRSLDSKLRGLLSPRYRRLDNVDLAECVLPEFQRANAQVVSAQVTDIRLYLQAAVPGLQREIDTSRSNGHDIGHGRVKDTKGMKVGDIVQAFAVVRNSEVGCGSLAIEPGLYRLGCLNGLIMPDYSLKKYHVGRLAEEEGELSALFSNETLKADDKAFWLKVRDVIRQAFSKDLFELMTEKVRKAAGEDLPDKPEKVVELTAKKFGFGDELKSSVLTHLINGGDLSKWGLVNAVTRASSDVESYDQAVDLERVGGEILEANLEKLAA